MSEQPSWMPSDFKMDTARVEAALLRETFGPDSDDNEPIRALIATAVEKALAEQESRNKREVIEARIDVLDDLWQATKRDYSGRTVEAKFASHVTPDFIREEVARLASELAALESKGGEG